MTLTDNPLALSSALTTKTRQLCLGLESGAADILEKVTPTTAELLRWWFGEEMVTTRGGPGGGLNFHAGQKQAILNAIVAHEVLGAGQARWGCWTCTKPSRPRPCWWARGWRRCQRRSTRTPNTASRWRPAPARPGCCRR